MAETKTMEGKEERSQLLCVEGLSLSYGDTPVLNQVSFTLQEGQWLMVVGPNGAGKSSIIRCISQAVRYEGSIRYLGKDLTTYPPKGLAQNIGILSQQNHVGYAFTVREIVSLGRYAHQKGLLYSGDPQGEEAVQKALRLTGMEALSERSVLELSGGELQRMFLAQLFAQAPRLLILDEPTNHLDLLYQKQIFALVGQWLEAEGRAVMTVVHDLSLAKAYGDRALLLNAGRVLALGRVEEVLTRENLQTAYQMDVVAWMQELLGKWT